MNDKMEIMNGGKALMKALEKEGVKEVFGLPGGANLPMYDELFKSNIRHILVRHEQSAAHMADGFGRVSRKPGVCFATSGPGATNLLTGIATAQADSAPMVAVTGQVPVNMIGRWWGAVIASPSPTNAPSSFISAITIATTSRA